jgi:hypothetical protein
MISNRKNVSLFEEAKAGFRSLIEQTITVFVGFIVMLIVTGGLPSAYVIAGSFCGGIIFVAWSEQERLKILRSGLEIVNIDYHKIFGYHKSIVDYHKSKSKYIRNTIAIAIAKKSEHLFLQIGSVPRSMAGMSNSNRTIDLLYLLAAEIAVTCTWLPRPVPTPGLETSKHEYPYKLYEYPFEFPLQHIDYIKKIAFTSNLLSLMLFGRKYGILMRDRQKNIILVASRDEQKINHIFKALNDAIEEAKQSTESSYFQVIMDSI